MKNIFLLPTEKPSRLQKNKHNKLFLSEEPKLYSDCINQNIYITSDEEIKEGDAVIHDFGMGYELENPCDSDNLKSNTRSKIILTTDPDLIADGVQAIDDEFLEWFVKNPNCEFVEVEKGKILNQGSYITGNIVTKGYYEIIIPKEEPKQLTHLEIAIKIEEIEREERKQETLEVFAERMSTIIDGVDSYSRKGCKNAVIEGAKWQAERMYSEEEVLNFADFYHQYRELIKREKWEIIEMSKEVVFEKWFEQFKKK